MVLRIKFGTKPIFWIFYILKINRMTLFCNLVVAWPSYYADVTVIIFHLYTEDYTQSGC